MLVGENRLLLSTTSIAVTCRKQALPNPSHLHDVPSLCGIPYSVWGCTYRATAWLPSPCLNSTWPVFGSALRLVVKARQRMAFALEPGEQPKVASVPSGGFPA